jgi:fatty-acyl-CoA synthase
MTGTGFRTVAHPPTSPYSHDLERNPAKPGRTVAVMAPNIPEMVEAHFGVPMAGAVLNAINTRLDAAAVAFILEHGEADVLLTDTEFAPVIEDALAMLGTRPLVIDIVDPEKARAAERLGRDDLRGVPRHGRPGLRAGLPADEWQAIALNYTSGTTGNPKGVVYHHRGAYLNALGNSVSWSMGQFPVYLWTLPMFHCNGWCFPWTVVRWRARMSACAGSRRPRSSTPSPGTGHPSVRRAHRHVDAVNAPAEERPRLPAGGPDDDGGRPAGRRDRGDGGMGVEVTHVYGLTETYGPCMVSCAWRARMGRPALARGRRGKARQGVRYEVLEAVMVADPETMDPGAGRRRDDGRDHDARQHHDEGLSQEPVGDRGASPAAGSTPATSP